MGDGGGKPQKWRLTADGKLYRKARHEYPNGDIYEGEWVDGKRHGKGVHMYKKSGNKYVGEYVAGLQEGFGVMIWADHRDGTVQVRGRRYEGMWKGGKRHGPGVFILGNGGDSYDGDFEADKYHGKGEFTYKNGDRYIGDWKQGRWGGKGTIEYANGDKFEGELMMGLFHGHGTMTWNEQSGGGSYVGEFYRGKKHGLGKRVFANGDCYEGRFQDGAMAGEGTLTRVNGDLYVGDMKDDLFDGHGVLTHAFGDRYEGQMKRGQPYGRGKYTFADGGFYRGEYLAIFDKYKHGVIFPNVNGKRHGKGVRQWCTGNVYEGDWVDDQMHGHGTIKYAGGGTYEGSFRWGLKHGRGVETFGLDGGQPYICPLGFRHVNRGRKGRGVCRYEGTYNEGMIEGTGVLSCCDGRRYEGDFHRGDRCGTGTQVMVPSLEAGDPQRCFIGGVDGLYRPVLYVGQWARREGVQGGERSGEGYIEYANGDRAGGIFSGGFLHGEGYVRYGKSGKIRPAKFKFGGVVRWLGEAVEQDSVSSHLQAWAGMPTSNDMGAMMTAEPGEGVGGLIADGNVDPFGGLAGASDPFNPSGR